MSRLLALEGRTVEAVGYAQKATEMARENAAAWAALGMAFDWNGDITEAIEACKYAIELDPTYADGYAYLAEAYADAGRWLDANQAAQTALQLDDQSVDVHRNYGYVLERQANYWGAVEAYKQALTIHPNLAYIHLSVGQNYRRLGDLDSATSSFERAIEINPHHAQANYELGWTYLVYLGESDKAEIYLEQAVAADPEFGRAVGGLAIAYWQRRNYEDAIPNFERAIKLESASARRKAQTFTLTVEDGNKREPGPSLDIVMQGDFVSTVQGKRDMLQATLKPQGLEAGEDRWAEARGSVTLDARSGKYTLQLAGLPWPPSGQVYEGWFEGVYTLSGDPLSTGPLQHKLDASVEMESEIKWVAGSPIEYYYTLGLAYFYLADCEKAYPLFDAALQINPEEANALEGIRLCRAAE
jgi:tetratricopeptide (TPR) repeat protein